MARGNFFKECALSGELRSAAEIEGSMTHLAIPIIESFGPI